MRRITLAILALLLTVSTVFAADRDEFRRSIFEENTSEVLIQRGQSGSGHVAEYFDGTVSGGTLIYRLYLSNTKAHIAAIHGLYLNYTFAGGIGSGPALIGIPEVSQDPPNPVSDLAYFYSKDYSGITDPYWKRSDGTVDKFFFSGDTLDQLSLNYTVPSTASSIFTAADIQLDVSNMHATSEVHGLNIGLVGTTSGDVTAIGVHSGMSPIHQHTGAYATPSQTEYAGEIPSGGSWSDGIDGNTLFEADNDEIYIGAVAVFGELEVILSTMASQNENLVFEFYDTSPAWIAFTPVDGTQGMTQNGIVEWTSGDLTNWKSDADPGGADASAGYWIRLRRTRNNVTTDPVATTIKTLDPTEYYWDSSGDLSVSGITAVGVIDLTADSIGPTELDSTTGAYDFGSVTSLKIPTAADVSGHTAEGVISWDSDNDILYVGDSSAAVAIGGSIGVITKEDDVQVAANQTTLDFHGVNVVPDGGSESDIYPLAPVDDGLIFGMYANEVPTGWLNTGSTSAATLTTASVSGGPLVFIGHFDEGAGLSTADSGGNGNTLTFAPGGETPTWTASGQHNSAIDFDGNDYIWRADDADFDFGTTDPLSIAVWAYINDTTNSGFIVVKGDGAVAYNYAWYFSYSTNQLRLVGGTSKSVSHTFATGSWHHYAVTFDGTDGRFYVDGSQVGTAQTGALGSPNADILLVGFNDVAPSYFDGILDELLFFTHALSDDEVALIYNSRWRDSTYVDSDFGSGILLLENTSLSYSVPSAMPSDVFTIEMWLDPAFDGDDSALHTLFDMETASNTNRVFIIKDASDDLQFGVYDSASAVKTVESAVSWSAGAAQHIVATKDDANFILYLNGVNVDETETGAGTGLITEMPNTMKVGRDATTQSNELEGVVDVLRIYNRALTAKEVVQNYYATREGMK